MAVIDDPTFVVFAVPPICGIIFFIFRRRGEVGEQSSSSILRLSESNMILGFSSSSTLYPFLGVCEFLYLIPDGFKVFSPRVFYSSFKMRRGIEHGDTLGVVKRLLIDLLRLLLPRELFPTSSSY